MAKRVLIVDDEPLIVKGLKFSLEQEGYETDCAHSGEEALEKFNNDNFDIILLDVMLPGISGTDVCHSIRQESMIPIIMLTAKSADEDKIEGLTEGADDYLTKPFNVNELKARMKNLLKRSEKSVSDSELKVKDLVMDKEKRTVTIKGVEIELTAKEFDILLLLVTNPGKVFRREDLLEYIWKDYSGDIRTVDVHIRRLRQKIEGDQNAPEYVYTKWGVGYYFAQK
ncbi:MAG: response regulator transcription factor [Clostridiales bacterium]|nr:response regulator transcription factor [Clostridiales bacterium]